MICGKWTSRTPEMAFLVNQENFDKNAHFDKNAYFELSSGPFLTTHTIFRDKFATNSAKKNSLLANSETVGSYGVGA